MLDKGTMKRCKMLMDKFHKDHNMSTFWGKYIRFSSGEGFIKDRNRLNIDYNSNGLEDIKFYHLREYDFPWTDGTGFSRDDTVICVQDYFADKFFPTLTASWLVDKSGYGCKYYCQGKWGKYVDYNHLVMSKERPFNWKGRKVESGIRSICSDFRQRGVYAAMLRDDSIASGCMLFNSNGDVIQPNGDMSELYRKIAYEGDILTNGKPINTLLLFCESQGKYLYVDETKTWVIESNGTLVIW